jgi:hypothetical protein
MKKNAASPAAHRRPPQREPSKPRPASEVARNPRAQLTPRARHAVGNAARRDEPGADHTDAEGGDWMAEAITPAASGPPGRKERS